MLQSYHARSDPDAFHVLPSGSVGIPPVESVYLALAYRYARDHDLELPEVPTGQHFWSLIGDSEFREGSLLEALPARVITLTHGRLDTAARSAA